MQAKNRIILALDVDSKDRAIGLIKDLKDYIGVFKVGMQLFNTVGPEIVKIINDSGSKVFVDLKFHDIPNTVAAAGRVMTRLNCHMFNIHAAGGREMMAKLAAEVKNEAAHGNLNAPLILAVTVLTSISQQELERDMFISGLQLEDLVVKWALMAKEFGMSGVVCSPQEITAIRNACGNDFVIVTPGIRPEWAKTNDQKRITTPRQALDLGADYIVIGRPITKAQDPKEAAGKIIEELEA